MVCVFIKKSIIFFLILEQWFVSYPSDEVRESPAMVPCTETLFFSK